MDAESKLPSAILPGGTVTFLFTDIEGSTQLLNQLRDQYATLLATHHQIIREALEQWHGREVDTQGDAFFAAFPKATEAVAAVAQIQRALAEYSWPQGAQVQVRMGLHTGEPWLVEEGYVGMDVHRAARIGHVGYGGQVLLSETTAALVQDELPEGVTLLDLGRHRLKDMRRPEPIQQLVIEGLPSEFPPLKSLEALPAVQLDPSGDAKTHAPRQVGPSPYRGLAAFQESDTELFFGREAFTEQLALAVSEQQLVAVIIGPSGAGKSSAVFAGLLPQLREEGHWLIVEMRPGARPFHSLAGALLPTLEENLTKTDRLIETQKLAQAMRDGELSLFQVAELALSQRDDADRLLLVIDQFEEIFTLRPDPEDQQLFLDELLAAAEAAASHRRAPLVLLLTLRADFMGQALGHRPFTDVLQEGSLILGPMNREELQAAIEKPAELAGAAFEPGLVNRILDDVGEEPGNLPLLEFALTLLWDRMEAGWLTHAGYEEIGQVEGALAKYADEVYSSLSTIEQAQARRVFVQLVQPGQGTEDTRRVAKKADLVVVEWDLVQHLADKRLIVTGVDETGEETVEVVHEALIRGWEELRGWMEADREFRSWQEGLRTSVAAWKNSGRDEGALLRGAPLAVAQEWLAKHEAQISSAEREYVELSRAEVEARQQKAKEQQERERALERRSLQRLRLIVTVLVVASVLGITLTAAVLYQYQIARRNETLAKQNAEIASAETQQRATAEALARSEQETAETQAALATSRELASKALLNLEQDPELGILLAMQAFSVMPTSESIGALHQTIQNSRIRQTLHPPDNLSALWLSFSPDGSRLFSAGLDGGAMWNMTNGQIVFTHTLYQNTDFFSDYFPSEQPEFFINLSDFSPDGSLLALPVDQFTDDESQPGYIAILDAENGEVAAVFMAHEQGVGNVLFSQDGSQLASTAIVGGQTTLWDVPGTLTAGTGMKITSFCCHDGWAWSVDFNPDDSRIVTAGSDDTVRVWDTKTGVELYSVSGLGARDAIFSPDGQYLVVAGEREVSILDMSNDHNLTSVPGPGQTFYDVEFNPDGTQLAASNFDGNVRIWKYHDGELSPNPLLLSGHKSAVGGISFTPDARYLASGSSDGTARIWDVSANGSSEFGTYAHDNRVIDVVFAPDGSWLASTSVDNTAKIWDVAAMRERFTFEHDDWVVGAAVHPDGRTLATSVNDGTVHIWDAYSGEEELIIQAHEPLNFGYLRGAKGLSFSPDGQRLATSGADELVKVWDVETGDELLTMNGHTGTINAVAYSPDGRWLISSGNDGAVKVWDPANGHEIWTLPGDRVIFEASFSSDSSKLVTGQEGGWIVIWSFPDDDAASEDRPEKILEFQPRPQAMAKGVFSPDGSLLAIAGPIQTSVHDADTGDLLFNLGYSTTKAAFSPDGHLLATAGNDGLVRLFAADQEELTNLASTRVTRSLTMEECQTYLHVEECPQNNAFSND